MQASYHEIQSAWDQEFARNRRLHGSRIQCRAGCSDCCSQLFQITEPEAAAISKAVAALPDADARDLRERALQYLSGGAALLSQRADIEEEAWGSLPPPGSRLPCPALASETGTCRIYDARPLICRKFGVPLWNPERPGRVYACQLNFRDGEAIEDSELIQIHTGLHERWKGLQSEYNERGGYRDPKPITVARAILEDFSGLTVEESSFVQRPKRYD